MRANVDRRSFIAGMAAMIGAAGSGAAVEQRGKTRLILLGTAGGPRPRKTRAQPAQVILVDDIPYVVDCGDGVVHQLAMAGVPLAKLRHVFITHHHSDHNADYGNLLWLAWVSGLRTRVDTWGPPPLDRMTRLFFEMNSADIEARIADEGRVPLVPLVHAHDLTEGGEVMKDENVRVTAALVHHPPTTPAFAYRFDTPARSIVISGDTTRSENLIELAQGADILVHEAMHAPAVERLVAGVANATALKQSILGHHTTAEDAGRVAQAAGVKMLVLSHLVPAEDPAISDQMWIDAARMHYRGQVVLGRDLLEL